MRRRLRNLIVPAGVLVALAIPADLVAQGASGQAGVAVLVSDEGAASLPAAVEDAAPVPVPPAVMTRDDLGRVTVRATRLVEGLVLDGRLDEPAYAQVAAISGFLQQEPFEGQPSSQRTDVWIFFDDEHLYVSARCWQDPSVRLVATERRRDGWTLFDNDNFAVILDTFRDRRNGFVFQTNPLGVIVDQQMTDEGATFNRDWNTVWDARASRDAEGWTVEMAIPFKSLRFPPGRTQVWGINFRRSIQSRNEITYLTAIPASAGRRGLARVSLAATLVGLEIDRPPRRLEVKPYVTASVLSDFEADPPVRNESKAQTGVDVKIGLGEGITADVTVNTDFAQVEEDEQQVNLTRFALALPEKREFFLEGQGLFAFGGVSTTRGPGGGGDSVAPALFFSRRVGLAQGVAIPIVAGGRVTGRVGGWSFGGLQIRQDASAEAGLPVTDFTVLRLRRDVLRRSSVGVIYTRRSPSVDGPGTGEAGGFDLLLAPQQDLAINAFVAASRTPGRSSDNLSWRARVDYNSDRYGLQAEHLVIEPNFVPEVGLVRRGDMQRSQLEGRVSRRPASLDWLRRWSIGGGVEYVADNAGRPESRRQQGFLRLEPANGDEFQVNVRHSFEALSEEFDITDGVVVPVGAYRFTSAGVSYEFGPRHLVPGEISVSAGEFYNGTIREAAYRARIEMLSALTLEPSVSLNRIALREVAPVWLNVARLRATWALSPRASASTLVQYRSDGGSLSASARFRWEYRPGSDLFIVYSEGRDTLAPRAAVLNRSFAVKMTRLFRF